MVLCPWCGTASETFQPNCARCGGPVPTPREAVAQAPEEALAFPPAPPRAISDQYRWKLMRADAWCQGAFVFALLGAIFTVVGFFLTIAIITAFVGIDFLVMGLGFLGGGVAVLYWRYKEAMKSVNILRSGEAARGEIVEARSNTSVQVNGRNPLTLEYLFEAGGKVFQGKLTTLNPLNLQFHPGQAVCVLYLPEDPGTNSLYPHP